MKMGNTPTSFCAWQTQSASRREINIRPTATGCWFPARPDALAANPPLFGEHFLLYKLITGLVKSSTGICKQTYTTVQVERLSIGGEGRWCEGVRVFAIVHLSQQAVVVDLDLGLLHGRHHGSLHSWITEAGDSRFRRREDEMDTRSTDTKAEQSLHCGVDIDVVSVHDGVIWGNGEKETEQSFHGGQFGSMFLSFLCLFAIVQQMFISQNYNTPNTKLHD